MPRYAYRGDNGFDLFSVEKYVLKPGERHPFRLGIAAEIPAGYGVICWPKSGLAFKHGISVLAGLIDSGYRGEWLVTLINHGKKPFRVAVGDKVAQGILLRTPEVEIVEVKKLSASQRGEKRFGSSGR